MSKRRLNIVLLLTAVLAGYAIPSAARAGGGPITLGDANGSIVLSSGALLAQGATDGFLYIPAVATGAPSGTPTSKTGGVAITVDSVNNVLYFYSGGAWVKSSVGGSSWAATLSAGATSGGTSPQITNGDDLKFSTDTFVYRPSAGVVQHATTAAGVNGPRLLAATGGTIPLIMLPRNQGIGWSATVDDASAAADTSWQRNGAQALSLYNGAAANATFACGSGSLATVAGARLRSGDGYGWSSSATAADGAFEFAFIRQSAGLLNLYDGTNKLVQLGNNGSTIGIFGVVQGGYIRWATSTTDVSVGTADLFINRQANGVMGIGSSGGGSTGTDGTLDCATVQQAPSSGTNIAGNNLLAIGGLATGNAAGGDFVVKTSGTPNGSGSSVQSVSDRFRVAGKTKTLSTSSGSLTTFAQIALGTTLTETSGTIYYSIKATSATDVDTASGHVDFTAVNKAATLSVTAGTVTDVKANTNGSITSGFTVTASGTTVQLNVTPVFTTIVPTAVVMQYSIILNGDTATITVN